MASKALKKTIPKFPNSHLLFHFSKYILNPCLGNWASRLKHTHTNHSLLTRFCISHRIPQLLPPLQSPSATKENFRLKTNY